MHKATTVFIRESVQAEANLRRIRILFRILAVSLGALHVYAAIRSQSMNADGISYLDIGDAYFRADWANAINPVWSPLYSWILGFANAIFRPSMEWEFPTVHVMNLLIYLGALVSFEFMWGGVRPSQSKAVETGTLRIPEWLWWVLGYLLFIWTSLCLIQIWSVTPDMLMASFVFLAAGLVARIRAGDQSLRVFLGLGLVLGLGYLSKTFMFSIAWVFLSLGIIVPRKSSSFPGLLLATVIFLVISVPFISLISRKEGRFTIGEAGAVTYLRYVNGIPFPHWQGNARTGMIPKHPSRIIHESPAVYEFGEPVGGTYPISTDPSYWYEGLQPRFDFKAILGRLFASSAIYADLFFQKQAMLLACALALYAMCQRRRYTLRQVLQRWALTILAIIALGLYATVLVAGRYVGAFTLLFWVDILGNIQLYDTPNHAAWLKILAVIGAIGLLVTIMIFNWDGLNRLSPSLQPTAIVQTTRPAKPLEVAQALDTLGVKEGDKVGVIGYAYDSFWARLAHVKIVAEMLDTDAAALWEEDKALRQNVLQSFGETGARAVIAEDVPGYVQLDGWARVGQSSYFIYLFGE